MDEIRIVPDVALSDSAMEELLKNSVLLNPIFWEDDEDEVLTAAEEKEELQNVVADELDPFRMAMPMSMVMPIYNESMAPAISTTDQKPRDDKSRTQDSHLRWQSTMRAPDAAQELRQGITGEAREKKSFNRYSVELNRKVQQTQNERFSLLSVEKMRKLPYRFHFTPLSLHEHSANQKPEEMSQGILTVLQKPIRKQYWRYKEHFNLPPDSFSLKCRDLESLKAFPEIPVGLMPKNPKSGFECDFHSDIHANPDQRSASLPLRTNVCPKSKPLPEKKSPRLHSHPHLLDSERFGFDDRFRAKIESTMPVKTAVAAVRNTDTNKSSDLQRGKPTHDEGCEPSQTFSKRDIPRVPMIQNRFEASSSRFQKRTDFHTDITLETVGQKKRKKNARFGESKVDKAWMTWYSKK